MQPGHWTVGVLIYNVFSVAGSSHRPHVNQMLLQYFVNYNLSKGYYLTSRPIVTANWTATGSIDAATGKDVPGGTWTLPFGRRSRPNQTAGISTNQLDPAVLWERSPSAGRVTMEFQIPDCSVVSKDAQEESASRQNEQMIFRSRSSVCHTALIDCRRSN
jgi:hypothetical protein